MRSCLAKRNQDKNHSLHFRIGTNLGDFIEQGDHMHGDGVNLAARIEKLADPGGIWISRSIFDQIIKKVTLGYEYLGEQQVNNISKPVGVCKPLTKPEDARIGKVNQLRNLPWSWSCLFNSTPCQNNHQDTGPDTWLITPTFIYSAMALVVGAAPAPNPGTIFSCGIVFWPDRN